MAIRNLLIKLDAQEVMQLMLFDISTHLKSSIGVAQGLGN
jgi:hypothetical protein